MDKAVVEFIHGLVRYLLFVIVLIAALGRLGVQTASVVAVIGAAGLAVGLALQGSLSNFAAGVLIVAFRPFKSGDYVEIGGVAGSVEAIQIFQTVLKHQTTKWLLYLTRLLLVVQSRTTLVMQHDALIWSSAFHTKPILS